MLAFTACWTMCRDKQFQDEDKLKHLAEMLWYADQAYEGESERTLSKRLEKRGENAPLIFTRKGVKSACRACPDLVWQTWMDSSLAGNLRRISHACISTASFHHATTLAASIFSAAS